MTIDDFADALANLVTAALARGLETEEVRVELETVSETLKADLEEAE